MKELYSSLFPLGFKRDFLGICKISYPIAFTVLINACLPITSVAFCGKIGTEELGAITIAALLFNVIGNSPNVGFGTALDTLLPQFAGGEDKKKIGILLQKSLAISVITSMIASSIILNIKYFLFILLPDINVVILADNYLKCLLPSFFLYSINYQLGKYLQSQKIVNPIMFINACAFVVNIILQYVFVYMLKLGMNGSALGMNLTSLMTTLSLILFIYFTKIYIETWPGWTLECFSDWDLYLKLAIPGFLMTVLEWVAWEAGNLASGMLGTTTLGVMSICFQAIYICMQIISGLDSGANVYIGTFIGANKPAEAINSAKVFFVIFFSISTIICAVLNGFSSLIPYAFTNNPEIIERSKTALKVMGLISFLTGFSMSLSTLVRTVGKQFHGSIIVVVAFYVITLPIAFPLMFMTSLGIYGFFIALIIGLIFYNIPLAILIFRTDWIEYSRMANERAKIEKNETNPFEIKEETSTKTATSFKWTLLKRFVVYVIIISIFLASFVTNSYKGFENSHKNISVSKISNKTSL